MSDSLYVKLDFEEYMFTIKYIEANSWVDRLGKEYTRLGSIPARIRQKIEKTIYESENINLFYDFKIGYYYFRKGFAANGQEIFYYWKNSTALAIPED